MKSFQMIMPAEIFGKPSGRKQVSSAKSATVKTTIGTTGRMNGDVENANQLQPSKVAL
jgi:hypothetical protein